MSYMGEDNYSLSSRVFHTIRENILSGKYATDEELKEKNIGEELGVSRTPVREALRQLELEGLVTIIPNKGAYVVGIYWQTPSPPITSLHTFVCDPTPKIPFITKPS